MKQFDGGGRQSGINFLPGKTVGNRIVVADEFDVIVDTDLQHFPFGNLVTHGRQWPQGGMIEFGKGRQAAARQLLEGPFVERRHEFGNAPVQFAQAEDALVPHPRGEAAELQ